MDVTDAGATPEAEIKEELVTEEQPKSMDDTIRDTLRELTKSDEEAPVGAGAEVKERNRDITGKFAGDIPPDVEKLIPEQPKSAPNTWKKEAQEAWVKADPVIRAEVERREADFHKGIEQYKHAAVYAQTMDKAMEPYKGTLQQLGLTPDRAISELMGADHKLRYGSPQEKSAYFMQLAHTYGINLGQVAQAQQSIDPSVYNLQLQNQNLQNQLRNQQHQVQQQVDASLNNEIATFSADPKHSHFESVKGHMAALLQAGQAQNLNDAYEQAIYANPVTRAAVLQQQAQASKDEASKKAQAAKAASSINVRNRPSMPVAQPLGSIDETIRSTYRRLTGAS